MQKTGDTSPQENFQQLREAGEKQARQEGGSENKCRVAWGALTFFTLGAEQCEKAE